ncbi:hypothetical protein MADA3029_290006 [Vibrio nigripulchritudo MADA3029]|nr:hypothetical protein VIBNIMADA3020_450006 [Vibrio nigripulchritudo MADA3020]CCN56087.1 hypothetical protein VIBNIMADA3021_870009 [Vibrio nigripulchritudo MADA3021]CCN58877.1 hypothetical protein MADA3029_290006 [Vibrio nigripulchritudo MADA3029]
MPPYQTSARGLFFSASIFASVLPEPLRTNEVFTPYLSENALVPASHIAFVALQYTISRPSANISGATKIDPKVQVTIKEHFVLNFITISSCFSNG